MSIQERVLKALNKPLNVQKAATRLKLTERQLRTGIDRLRASGYNIENTEPCVFQLAD